MKTYKTYLGIDVSKSKLHLGNSKKFLKEFSNSSQGHQELIKLISEHDSTLVIVEASGGYERSLCEALQDAGIDVHVAQPGCVRHFAKSLKVLAKTDQIDATVIARFGEATQPKATPKTPKNVSEMRALCDRRQQIVEDRVRETNRLEKATASWVIQQIEQSVQRLEQLEKELDAKIKVFRE